MWIRASLAGFTFARHPKPLGWYTCRPGSLSSSDTRMLSGILRVFAKTRPALPAASPERAILDQQVARFEMELLAAEARDSLHRGDAREAARIWRALHATPRRLDAAPRRRRRHAARRGWRWPRIACASGGSANAAGRARPGDDRSRAAAQDQPDLPATDAAQPRGPSGPAGPRALIRLARRIDQRHRP